MRLRRVLAYVCAAGLAASCAKKPVSMDIAPKKVKIYGLERSQRLAGRLLDKDGQPMDTGPITWTSAKPDIVTVDSSGRLVAKKEGKTVVTATYGKLSLQIPVEVVDVKVLAVSPVQATLIGPVGTRLNLLLTEKNSADKSVDIKPVWSSSNEAVATVSQDGVVSSVSPGSVTVAAKVGDLQAIIDLKVEIKQISRLEVKPATAIVRVGDSQHFEIVAYGSDGLAIEGAFAFFVSSNPAVASVDGSGLATGLSPGAAVIRAQLGGVTAEATLLVNNAPSSAPR
jgi:trimeric autotransporter adhesin